MYPLAALALSPRQPTSRSAMGRLGSAAYRWCSTAAAVHKVHNPIHRFFCLQVENGLVEHLIIAPRSEVCQTHCVVKFAVLNLCDQNPKEDQLVNI